ncbi:MAG: DUF2764 family protein [Gammaproteobacteria bacterium]
MINKDFKYTLLLSSLPLHPADLFSCKIPPISRIQLDKRLGLLDVGDSEDLARIEGLLHWAKMPGGGDDKAIVETGQMALTQIRSPFLRDIVLWRLELRTILTALRRRQAGESRLGTEGFYGFGNRLHLIRRNWQRPDFGLGQSLPWVKQAQQLMAKDETYALDKLLFGVNWQYYSRLNLGHYFDFPAVVLYVLRWDLIHRWVSYDRDRALLRFNELICAALADVSLECEESHERT